MRLVAVVFLTLPVNLYIYLQEAPYKLIYLLENSNHGKLCTLRCEYSVYLINFNKSCHIIYFVFIKINHQVKFVSVYLST